VRIMNGTQVRLSRDPPEADRRVDTRTEPARPLRRRELRAGEPTWLGRVTQPLDVRRHEEDHGLRNAVIAVASAVCLGALSGATEWSLSRNESYFGAYLLVDALGALVLTPLVVGVFLALPDLTRRLLWRLREDRVIGATSGRELEAAPEFCWFNHRMLVLAAGATAALYLAFELVFEHKDLTPPTGILVVLTLAARATMVYLAVVTVVRLLIVSRAVGRLLREQPVQIQPLHPDGCGGLWIVGRLFNLMLNVAAVLGGVALCVISVLQGTPMVPVRRPELYLLAAFYVGLLPSAFLNLLWRPHQLLEAARGALLKPMAREFHAAAGSATPSTAVDVCRLAAKADSLSRIVKQMQILDEVWPAWPLRMKRLRAVIVTAILPVGIPLVTAVAIPLVTRAYSR
jgi:hypothetical protein